jgi:RNA polymerase sigma-70 factor (ECF subfamily)
MSPDDVEHLTRLVAQRAAALVLYARQWLDPAGADDAVQDAFAALVAQRRPPDNPAAWLYRAVRNAALDQVRSAVRRRRREQSVAQERRELFESSAESQIDAATAEEWLNQLGPVEREVIVLRIWGELTFAEIADVMRLGVSTIHDRYRAALAQLRRKLEQPCPTKIN